MAFHPDITGNPETADHFREICKAYHALMNPCHFITKTVAEKARQTTTDIRFEFTQSAPTNPELYKLWLAEVRRRMKEELRNKPTDPNFTSFQRRQERLAKNLCFMFIATIVIPTCLLLGGSLGMSIGPASATVTSFSMNLLCSLVFVKGCTTKFNPEKNYQ